MNELHVNLYDGQGLGNQLWVIFSCVGLALKSKRRPVIYGIENYKGDGYLNLKIDKIAGPSPSQNIVYEKISFDLIYGLDQTNHETIMSEILKKQNIDQILLIGNLQSISLLPEPNEKILDYLILKIENKNNENSFLSIHLRGGDYAKTICQPPAEYYYSAMNFLVNKGIFFEALIVTDDIHYAKNTLRNIKIASPENSDSYDTKRARHHQGNGTCHDFTTLLSSKYSIISASTFSFWAALLGKLINKNKVVVAPAYWYANRVSKKWWSLPDSQYKSFIYLTKFGNEILSDTSPSNQRVVINKSDIYPPLRNIANRLVRFIF